MQWAMVEVFCLELILLALLLLCVSLMKVNEWESSAQVCSQFVTLVFCRRETLSLWD